MSINLSLKSKDKNKNKNLCNCPCLCKKTQLFKADKMINSNGPNGPYKSNNNSE